MKPQFKNCNVVTRCPDCNGSITTYERQFGGRELGYTQIEIAHHFDGKLCNRIIYQLMRCAGCGRGGVAKIHDSGNICQGLLESFYPTSPEMAKLPQAVPPDIQAEYREAELCASFGAYRASSALIRSALEKTLKVNGYSTGSLANKIDQAAKDGTITSARGKKAHEDIRVLGNDVLHEEWREVKEDEVEAALHYTQRILEDFYDDRSSTEKILITKKRISRPKEVQAA